MKQTLRKLIGKGFLVFATNKTGLSCIQSNGYYLVDDSKFNTSHKLIDPCNNECKQFAKEVKKTTTLGSDRLYTIYQSIYQVHSLDGCIAEVGSYKGGGSFFMARCMESLKEPYWNIHTFDTFEGHDKRDITDKDNLHKAGSFGDTSYEVVCNLLKPFSQVHVHKGRIQDTAHLVKNKVFKFVYLDMDIYEPTKFALEFFGKRMVPGGIIISDDYGLTTCDGEKKAVDEFRHAHPEFIFMYLHNGQAMLIRR